MLVAQAVRARELFTGEALPDEIIEREYRHLLHSKRNIVLCGMPSCGKSTLGRALADACGRRFVDTDEIVALQAGMDIPRIFELEGEAGFRTRETIAIESIAPEQGLVIATGGGAPLLIHCFAGVSRSMAVGAFASELLGLPYTGSQTFNRYVYDLLKEVYRKGAHL